MQYNKSVDNLVSPDLNKMSMEQYNVDYNKLTPKQLSEFNGNNLNRMGWLRLKATKRLGPSPKEQILNQVQQKITTGFLIPVKETPVQEPVYLPGN